MKLLIFGATGGTGRKLVEQALSHGHDVTAFVRNPAAIERRAANLIVHQGDVLDAASIAAALNGQDAVLSALGTKVLQQNNIVSTGTANILKAMTERGVRRFICETSLGLGDSKEQTGFFFARIFVPLILKNVFADKEIQEQLIRASDTDWVIVRPARLTNGTHTGQYRAGFSTADRTIKGKISRADVADFMLKQISDNTYVHQTPGISY